MEKEIIVNGEKKLMNEQQMQEILDNPKKKFIEIEGETRVLEKMNG